jgi:ABC-2 type transport system permease protein
MLIEFFNNPELAEVVQTQMVTESEAVELVENGELHAFVNIPEGFSYAFLSSIMFGEEVDVALTIRAEEQSTELRTLQNLIGNYIDSVNLQFALGSSSGSEGEVPVLPEGGREVIEGVEMFSFSQYITIAMITLFALFMAQTVSMKTITEKRELVFNRIILTNSPPLHFLSGKILATFCLAWIQMAITFLLSQFVFKVFSGKSMEFWVGLILVITIFSLTIAGLSAIFTSLALYIKDTNAVNGLTSVIIMGMAVVGGSFAPIQSLPVVLQRIGEWTPSGLTLTMLLEWIQFTNFEDLILPTLVHISYFVVCLIVSIAIFPKRGVNG